MLELLLDLDTVYLATSPKTDFSVTFYYSFIERNTLSVTVYSKLVSRCEWLDRKRANVYMRIEKTKASIVCVC